jgi:2-dehydro-3-deoxygalactonokinase
LVAFNVGRNTVGAPDRGRREKLNRSAAGVAPPGFSAKAPRMRWANGFIAVDWGTTNRRAYLVNSSGKCADEFEDGNGALSVPSGRFADSVAEIRARLGDLPMLLAGMVGSNRGWVEAPYARCPAGLKELAGQLVWADDYSAIVPGVAYVGDGRADVMRGEEVQLLGAMSAGMIPPECLVCHPGTHNKWVRVEGGCIAEFRTVMTGELFNLLKNHSILADLLKEPAEPNHAFLAGVRHALETADLTSELFAIRARVLLGEGRREDAAPYASGLLIGSDVRVGLSGSNDRQAIVMGRPELTRLYAAAVREAGREAVELDGEQSFLAGAIRIAELI